VQAELGVSPTPLEVPGEEWAPASEPVDFGDDALRGPPRPHLESETRRKLRPGVGVAALARDEDTDISSPPRSRARRTTAIAIIVAAIVTVVAGIVTALFATGVL